MKLRVYSSLVIFLCSVILTSCGHRPLPTYNVPAYLPESPIDSHKPINVCVVLGGGGAKGMAHVGVLEVLEEEGIPIDMIVGTSAGSVIGAFYADCKDAKKVKAKVMPLKRWDLLDLSYANALLGLIRPTGGVGGVSLREYLYENMGAKCIEDLQIPFVAVATDIIENKSFAIDGGPVAPAVHASAALPPVFTPVKLYGKLLVDGGAIEPVPVPTAKKYRPKFIIAVDISSPPTNGDDLSNMVWITYRALDNAYYEFSRLQSKMADVDIHPALNGFGTFEDHRNGEVYEKGKEAARKILPLIKAKLIEKGLHEGFS